jgi:hypothetical protein
MAFFCSGLFGSEALDGVGQGGFEGLEADGDQCDSEGENPGNREGQPADMDAVGEFLQPAVHGPPGQGDGGHEGDGDEQEEVAGQDEQQVPGRGAEDFADAYLFGALGDVVGGETEQAQAGDDDGEGGKEAEDGAKAFVLGILLVEIFIQEEILKRIRGEVLLPDCLDGGDGLGCVSCPDFDGIEVRGTSPE